MIVSKHDRSDDEREAPELEEPRVRLERETLKDLTPPAVQGEGVKGGQTTGLDRGEDYETGTM